MSKSKEDKDIILLTQLENISKNISNLVNHGQYNEIDQLNQIRLDLIKSFKNKSDLNFRSIVGIIRKDNVENIKKIELQLNKVKEERSRFIKRFKAYNKN
tara:strand:- start:629 stop:928 length:300 start_codon:yes stop_codon:yes gene_type:complete